MPRNVRNFWIEAEIDGPRGVQKIKGGPAASTGAFRLTVYQRHEGRIVIALSMEGFAQNEGSDLILNVHNSVGESVLQSITKRDPIGRNGRTLGTLDNIREVK